MKLKITISIMLFSVFGLNAQIQSIQLPKGEDVISISKTSITPIYSLYVDKHESIYLEDEAIALSDLAKTLSYNRSQLEEMQKHQVKIFLYIDQSVKYTIVDKIKTELASANFYNLVFKTNTIKDKDIVSGFSVRNHQSFFHLEEIKKVLTKKEEAKNKRYNDSIAKLSKDDSDSFLMFPPPPPPPVDEMFALGYRVYTNQQEIIDEVLQGKTYNKLVLSDSGLKYGKNIIKITDNAQFIETLNAKDFAFISFDPALTYSNYFKFITLHRQLSKKGWVTKPYLELSNEIIRIHKKANIKL
ncbi:biopolymer transporter ExbD [Olleya sp. UBA1516]|uniref:ExbD/TolR family protein n=1 Tax=Olleya sp. UBA1516 TaxID=1947013 RepID=UPI0025CD5618|nr:biopolymer transporter ExbD [Olleya sp. UBA1516]